MSIVESEHLEGSDPSAIQEKLGCIGVLAPSREDDDLLFYNTDNPQEYIQVREDFYISWQ